MKIFLFPGLLLFAMIQGLFAQTSSQLFAVERSKNRNCLYYEANIDADSLLNEKQPLHAYWVMWQKDPSGKTREELSLLEKQKGFGFKTKLAPNRKFAWFTLIPLPARSIKVSIINSKAISETVINNRFSLLNKIFISTVEKNFLPKVLSIELFGKDVKTGEDTYEKIIN